MKSENSNGKWVERRQYPRIKASCPVRYQIESEDTWHEATLMDYSATGVSIRCDELILKGSSIKIEVLPGCTNNIPKFSAVGVAVRFSLDEHHRFLIGCEFEQAISILLNTEIN